MSQRLGMADGRCFTINTSSRLTNDYVMTQTGIPYQDNYSFRKFLQANGPKALEIITSQQRDALPPSGNFVSCQSCNKPLLKVPNTY